METTTKKTITQRHLLANKTDLIMRKLQFSYLFVTCLWDNLKIA